MKKIALLITTVLLTTAAYADTSSSLNLALPSAPQAYGQDSIRAGELDCKNAIGGATNLEFGVTGIVDNADTLFSSSAGESSRDIGIFARITIPLDKPKSRINCNELYQLELRKKRLEVLKLQQELEALQRLNQSGGDFEN